MDTRPDTPTTADTPLPDVEVRQDKQVFSNRLLAPMLRFYQNRYGRLDLEETIASLGYDVSALEDLEGWTSVRTMRRLNRRMVERTGNPMITYEAGLGLYKREVLGPLLSVVLYLRHPRVVYESLNEHTRKLSKIVRWDIPAVDDQSATMVFTAEQGQDDDPLFCLNRAGALAGVPTLFELPPATVDHPRCIHRGDDCCEYRVRWGRRSTWWITALLSSGLLAVLVWLLWQAYGLTDPMTFIAPGALAVVAAGLLGAGLRRRVQGLQDAAQAQNVDMQAMIEKGEQAYRELLLLDRVDRLTREHLRVETLVGAALEQVVHTLDYNRALLLRVGSGGATLGRSIGVGFGTEFGARLEALEVEFDPTLDGPGVLEEIARGSRARIVTDPSAAAAGLPPTVRSLLAGMGAEAVLLAPVRAHAELLGLLVLDQSGPDRRLGEHDERLAAQIAHRLGLAISHTRLVESLQTQLLLNRKFSAYLPGELVERLLADPAARLELGGEKLPAAVLFSDVADFTSWAESRDPAEVVDFLNAYFAAMDEVINQSQGILDKRMGDGLLVVFLGKKAGAAALGPKGPGGLPRQATPLPSIHPARRALLCALAMQTALRGLAEHPRHGPSFRDLRIRIGVAYGELVAGNMGSTRTRLEFTVVGDVVNVASRLESLSPPGSIYATRSTVEAAGGRFAVEARGELDVKGRDARVDTVAILGVHP